MRSLSQQRYKPLGHLVLLGLLMGLVAQNAFGALTIVHDTGPSVIPPRAKEAMDFDPLGVWGATPQDDRMNVGVLVQLRADAPGQTVEVISWMITGSVIKDYTARSAAGPSGGQTIVGFPCIDQGDNTDLSRRATEGFVEECSTTNLSASDLLQQDTISYYYTAPGNSVVTLTASVDGGPPTMVTKTFVVERDPKAEKFWITGDGGSTWTSAQFLDPFEDRYNTIGEHPRWHCVDDGGDEFCRFHRGFIQKGNCWRGIFGYPCVKVYATAPGYVPTGDDFNHPGLCCSSLAGDVCTGSADLCETNADCVVAGEMCEERVGTGIINRGRRSSAHGNIEELPVAFTIAGGLAAYPVGGSLCTDMQSPYHNSHHSRLCNFGDFTPTETTPADPIFHRFHSVFTKIFELWQLFKLDDGSSSIPPVECTSPAGAQAFFPDPDFRLTGCLNPVLQNCAPQTGSVFPLGTTNVACTVKDVMMLDDTFPASVCSDGSGPCGNDADCPGAETCDPTNQGTTADVDFDVTVQDTTPPSIICPADTTIECDESTAPSNTGMAMATDVCDSNPMIGFSDVITPGVCPQEVTISRTWTATDADGNDNSCVQTIEVVDTTEPTLGVVLDPDVLWPPNHKLWDITATITVDDNCDSDPDITLDSITSNEPDNSTGDGNTINDIQDFEVGTDDREFRLRAERRGQGDGRVYTVTYTATDDCGNFTTESAEVVVPHDQSGSAAAWSGFTADGTALQSGTATYQILIPSSAVFDALRIDTDRLYVGNYVGVQTPVAVAKVDYPPDGLADLLVTYAADPTLIARAGSDFGFVSLYFKTLDGILYSVPDIFLLGPPIKPEPAEGNLLFTEAEPE